jgi:hypothetical protein
MDVRWWPLRALRRAAAGDRDAARGPEGLNRELPAGTASTDSVLLVQYKYCTVPPASAPRGVVMVLMAVLSASGC